MTEGNRLFESFVCGSTPYIIRAPLPSLLWSRCVHGVFELGCILLNYRLYAHLAAAARTSFPISLNPHTTSPSSPSLTLRPVVLSRSPPRGSNTLYLRYAVRSPSPIAPYTAFRIYGLFVSLFCFLRSFSSLLVPSEVYASPTQGLFFLFSSSLNLDASSQVVCKNAQLRSRNM